MKKFLISISLFLLLGSCTHFSFQEKEKMAVFLQEYEVPNGKEYALFEYDSQYFFLRKDENFEAIMSGAVNNKISLPENISDFKTSTGEIIDYIEQNNPRVKEEWKSLDDTVYTIENYKWWNVLNIQETKLAEGLSSKEEATKWLNDNVNNQFCLIQIKQFISNKPHGEEWPLLSEAYGFDEIKKLINKTRVIEFYNNKPCDGWKQIITPKKEYYFPIPVKFTSKSGNTFGVDDFRFNVDAFMYSGDALISPKRTISKKAFQNVHNTKIEHSTFEYVSLGNEPTGEYGSQVTGEWLPEIYINKISETTSEELKFFGKYLKVYVE